MTPVDSSSFGGGGGGGGGGGVNVGPVLLRPQETSSDVICSICMSVPLDPVLTKKCDHMFCYDCIRRSLQEHEQCCPLDRIPCSINDIHKIQAGTFVHRIWCNVQVKCENHSRGCCWIGSIADFSKQHQNECYFHDNSRPRYINANEVNNSNGVSNNSNTTIEELELKIAHLREELREVKSRANAMTESIREFKRKENERNEEDIQTLRPSSGVFDSSYQYNRYNVVELNTLIACYLEDKPDCVDKNRIYNCIRICFIDYEKDWGDNPESYPLDVRMLLATSMASNWFTPKQFINIRTWLNSIDSDS